MRVPHKSRPDAVWQIDRLERLVGLNWAGVLEVGGRINVLHGYCHAVLCLAGHSNTAACLRRSTLQSVRTLLLRPCAPC